MKYFGVASCPYCKKRVNLLRTWSLKRQGEYQCPRCSGISNIFLSPLIYVFALLAVFSGGAVYFFHKFVLDDISLTTVGQVLIPFAIFFLLSLFMVHLEKPVIKKMTPAEIARKQRKERNQEQRKTGAQAQGRQGTQAPVQARSGAAAPAVKKEMFYDSEEYLPQREYRTGPLPAAEKVDLAKTAEVELPPAYQNVPMQRSTSARQSTPVQRPTVQRSAPAQRTASVQPQAAVSQPSTDAGRTPVQRAASGQTQAVSQVVYPSGHTAVRASGQSQAVSHSAAHADMPAAESQSDFFAKYDDPEYVARRLREIQDKND